MAVTTTLVASSVQQGKFIGGFKFVLCDISMGGTYVAAGSAISAGLFGLAQLTELIAVDSATKSGYVPQFNLATGKIKLFKGASSGTQTPTLAESVTVTSDSGTLAAVPCNVLAIHGTVGSTSTVFTVVPAARTLATKEVHVNYTTGAITFYASDDPTAVTVDYLPAVFPSASAALTEVSGTLTAETLTVMAVGF